MNGFATMSICLISLLPVSGQVCETRRHRCFDASCREVELSVLGDRRLLRIDHQKIVLRAGNGNQTLIFADKKRGCSASAAFVSGSRVYVEPCSGDAFVSDTNGTRLYKMPKFRFWDIALNRSKTRFAVFERGSSAWHELGQDTYDKLRLAVYSTSDGKKIFERKWSAGWSEHPVDETIGLSDDGSVLYLCRDGASPEAFPIDGIK